MTKFLDMPVGNDSCPAHDEYMAQIMRGRSVAVVRVLDEKGRYSCYINSGDPVDVLTERNTMRHALGLTIRARRNAEADGAHPVPGYTRELTQQPE